MPTLNINGTVPDWAVTEIAVLLPDGTPGPILRGGVESLDFENAIEGRENKYGNSETSVGQTNGSLGHSASMVMFDTEWVKLERLLGNGYMRADRQIGITANRKDGSEYRSNHIQASITNVSAGWSQGNALMRTITLLPSKITSTDADGKEIDPLGEPG